MHHLTETWEKFAKSPQNPFTCISQLPFFIGKTASNLFGIVTAVKEPTRSKDWSMNITISDPSCPPPARGFMILIFKSRKEECPAVVVGDVVKCTVKCQGYQGRAQGLISKLNHRGKLYVQILIQGDPSLTIADSSIFSNLKKWWDSLAINASSKEYIDRLVKAPTTSSKKRQELTFYDVGADGAERIYFDTYCKVIKNIAGKEDAQTQTLVITDFTGNRAESSLDYPMCLESGNVEELPILEPEYLIVLTLWDNHATNAYVPEGTYLFLQNVQLKKDSSGRFEYAIHGDPIYPKKKLVQFKSAFDQELAPLLKRERTLLQGSSSQLLSSNSQSAKAASQIPQTRPASFVTVNTVDTVEVGRKRDLDEDEFEDQDIAGIDLEAIQETYSQESALKHTSKKLAIDEAPSKLQPALTVPTTTTTESLALSSVESAAELPLKLASASIRQILTLPTPRRYILQGTIVDYLPSKVDEFVQAVCESCNDSYTKKSAETLCGCGEQKVKEYVYFFHLLIHDGSSYLPLLVSGKEGEDLVGHPPTPAFEEGGSEGAVRKALERFFRFGGGGSNLPKIEEDGGKVEVQVTAYTTLPSKDVLVKLMGMRQVEN